MIWFELFDTYIKSFLASFGRCFSKTNDDFFFRVRSHVTNSLRYVKITALRFFCLKLFSS